MFSAMAAYGMFVFGIQSLPYLTFERSTNWRYPKNSRIGRRASVQYLGPGDDIITLSGTLYPEITGGRISLAMVRYMADDAKAWPLILGNGISLGMYVIEDLQESNTEFFSNGVPRKIDFNLKLTRSDDDQPETYGSYTPELLAML